MRLHCVLYTGLARRCCEDRNLRVPQESPAEDEEECKDTVPEGTCTANSSIQSQMQSLLWAGIEVLVLMETQRKDLPTFLTHLLPS